MFRAALVATLAVTISLTPEPVVADGSELEPDALRAEIARISLEAGPFAAELGPHLRNLGDHYLAAGRSADAREQHGRWQHIIQRHDGVHTVRQLPAVNRMITAWTQEGQAPQVDRLVRFRFRIAERNYAPGSADLFGPLLTIGRWNAIGGDIADARRQLGEALDIARRNDDPHQQLQALRASAMAQYLNGRCCYEKTLKQAFELVSNDGRFDLIDRGVAARELADAYVMKRKHGRATPLYREADGLLPDSREGVLLGVPNHSDVVEAFTRTRHTTQVLPRRRIFVRPPEAPQPGPLVVGNPVTMCSSAVREFGDGRDAEDLALDVSLTVTSRGHVRDVRVSGAAPPKLKRYVRNTLLRSRYRPGTADGQRVEFTQSFSGAPVASQGLPRWSRHMAARGCQQVAML